jgi:hypothetical protein
MKTEKVMVDLEERLRADKDGSLLADIKKRLNEIQARLDGKQKKLHNLQEFELIQASDQAVQAALLSLQMFEAVKNIQRD